MSQIGAPSHEKLPIEVWHEIFESIFYSLSQLSLNPDPIETLSSASTTIGVGINVPAMLKKWESPTPLSSILRQRLNLLLVCKAWNNFATRVGVLYIRMDYVYIYKWHDYYIYKAKRLHADLSQPTCGCTGKCICRFRPYNDGSIVSLWKRVLSLQEGKDGGEQERREQLTPPSEQTRAHQPQPISLADSHSRPVFSTEILTFQNSEMKDFLISWSRFPHLKALTIKKGMDNYPRLIPTVQSAKIFTNLIYLHIIMGLRGQVFASPISNSNPNGYQHRLTFPSLTTLRYTFQCYVSDDITNVLGGKCSMPKLRHLYIESSQTHGSMGKLKIWEYVQIVGKDLLSLSINDRAIRIPWHSIFTDCPFLTSVATPCYLTELLANGLKRGLKTIVYTGNTAPAILDDMRRMVEEYDGLQALGASHDWDKASVSAKTKDDQWSYHNAKTLFEALLGFADVCSERGIRFEDCMGRTAEDAQVREVKGEEVKR